MARPFHSRPDYWCKEFIIEQMRKGIPVRQICLKAGEDIGSPGKMTFARDIKSWRMTDTEFRRVYDEILDNRQVCRGDTTNRFHNSNSPVFTPAKVDEFFNEMESNGGNYFNACKTLGLWPANILARINPKDSLYDPAFAERFHHLEGQRYSEAREKFFEMAMHGGPFGDGDPWVLHKILSAGFSTAHMHRETGILEVGGTIKHEHGLSPALQEAMAEKASTLFRNREAIREAKQLPSAEVITVEIPKQAEHVR